MTEKPEASVLTARRATQHFRLSSADDASEHLYILTVRSSLGPSPPNAGRYTVASRFRCRSCERGYIFPRAPEQFVASPPCLVGYVRWDARSDRVPPLQTIIYSSFPGRTPACRPSNRNTNQWLLDERLGLLSLRDFMRQLKSPMLTKPSSAFYPLVSTTCVACSVASCSVTENPSAGRSRPVSSASP
jgi:hypothetical protein